MWLACLPSRASQKIQEKYLKGLGVRSIILGATTSGKRSDKHIHARGMFRERNPASENQERDG